jgi:hypothetical protein
MDILLIVAIVTVVALLAVVLRRSSPQNLGFVSRDWVMKHSTDHAGV